MRCVRAHGCSQVLAFDHYLTSSRVIHIACLSASTTTGPTTATKFQLSFISCGRREEGNCHARTSLRPGASQLYSAHNA